MIKSISIDLFGKRIKLPLKQVNIISGVNGSGKTYLLKELTFEIHLKLINDFGLYLIDKAAILTLIRCLTDWYSTIQNQEVIENESNKIFLDIIRKYLQEKVDLFLSSANDFRQLESFKHLSSGQRNLIIYFTKAYLLSKEPKENRVIIIDDIESNLHFDIQKTLIEDLIKICPDLQIICSTHSPAVIMNGWRDCVIDMKDILK